MDPIYADLETQTKLAKAALDEEEKSLADVEKLLSTLDARDIQRKRSYRERNMRARKVIELRQNHLYLEIRSKQRLEFVKKDYLKAFYAKKPWPNPQEFAAYKAARTLRAAPREWDKRVPKLTRHNKMPAAVAPKAEEKGGGGH